MGRDRLTDRWHRCNRHPPFCIEFRVTEEQ